MDEIKYLNKQHVLNTNKELHRVVKNLKEEKYRAIQKLEAEIEECNNFISFIEQQEKMLDKMPTFNVADLEKSK